MAEITALAALGVDASHAGAEIHSQVRQHAVPLSHALRHRPALIQPHGLHGRPQFAAFANSQELQFAGSDLGEGGCGDGLGLTRAVERNLRLVHPVAGPRRPVNLPRFVVNQDAAAALNLVHPVDARLDRQPPDQGLALGFELDHGEGRALLFQLQPFQDQPFQPSALQRPAQRRGVGDGQRRRPRDRRPQVFGRQDIQLAVRLDLPPKLLQSLMDPAPLLPRIDPEARFFQGTRPQAVNGIGAERTRRHVLQRADAALLFQPIGQRRADGILPLLQIRRRDRVQVGGLKKRSHRFAQQRTAPQRLIAFPLGIAEDHLGSAASQPAQQFPAEVQLAGGG